MRLLSSQPRRGSSLGGKPRPFTIPKYHPAKNGRQPARWRLIGGLIAALLVTHVPARAQSVEELRDLSIEQLAEVNVSSVSKSTEKLSDAPAAIYVISHDDVIRSGATTIPEMLRLAPNLEVAQLNPTRYAITARGFNAGDNASLRTSCWC